jgi:hypothetical protein
VKLCRRRDCPGGRHRALSAPSRTNSGTNVTLAGMRDGTGACVVGGGNSFQPGNNLEPSGLSTAMVGRFGQTAIFVNQMDVCCV